MDNVTNFFNQLNLDGLYQFFDLVTPIFSLFSGFITQAMQFVFMALDFGTLFLGFV